MSDPWFDPLGLRRIGDAFTTAAAKTLIGRRIEIDGGRMCGNVSEVREASPSAGFSAALSGQLGLWRHLDLDLSDVSIEGLGLERVSVTADDVRVLETLPQRIGAKRLEVEVAVGWEQAPAWIDHLAAAHGVEIDGHQLIAPLKGFGSWGMVELDPWVDGRRAGVDVSRARVRGRTVNLPERFHRRFERELEWLPEGATLRMVTIDGGGVTVSGDVDRYAIEVDVPRLMADLSAKQAGAVIAVLVGG